MNQQVTRSSSRVPAATPEVIEGWEVYRLEGVLNSSYAKEMEERVRRTNEGCVTLMREAQGAAMYFQIELNQDHKLENAKAIPPDQIVGILYSSVEEEQSADKHAVIYKEDIRMRNGVAQVALTEQDTSAPYSVSGYGDRYLSNFWFATQNCVQPNCRSTWIRLPGSSRGELEVVVVYTNRQVEANTLLTMDFNTISGNIRGFRGRSGETRPPRMPDGKLGEALLFMFREKVHKCRCDPTCDKMLLKNRLSLNNLTQAEEYARVLTPKEQSGDDSNDVLGMIGGRCMLSTPSSAKQVKGRKRERSVPGGSDGRPERGERPVQQRAEDEAGKNSGEDVRSPPRDRADRRARPRNGNKEGTAPSAGSGGGLPPGSRSMACVQTLKKGGNAHHSKAAGGLSGIDQMRMAEIDEASKTSNLRGQIQEDCNGGMRRDDAGSGLSERRRDPGPHEAEDGSGTVSLRSPSNSSSRGNQSEISSTVEGIRHVRNSSRGASRSNASLERSRPSLGIGANDVGRNPLVDQELDISGAVQAHGVRIRASFEREIRVQTTDEGRRVTTRNTEETDLAFEKKHVAAYNETRRSAPGAESERVNHRVGNTAVLQSRGNQAFAGVRLSAGIRRAIQPPLSEGSSIQDSEKEARSTPARPLPSLATRLHDQTMHHPKDLRDAKRWVKEDFSTLHESSDASGEMPALSPTVCQLTETWERATAAVEAANLRSGEVNAQTDRNRLETCFGDLDATRRNIGGDSRTSAGASSLSAERSRRRDRSEIVYGPGGPARPLRDGSRSPTLNNLETTRILQSLIQQASAYGAGSSMRSQAANPTGHDEVADLLSTAILRTWQNLSGANALGMMGEERTIQREARAPRFTLAARGGKLDREMDRHLGINMRSSSGRAAHLTFARDWNIRDEHGELRRPGLEHKRSQELEDKTETESDGADEYSACGGGFKNNEPDKG